MALRKHFITQNSLENTRCWLLLLQAMEDHNATLMLRKIKCKLHHMAHGRPCGESFQNVTKSLANLGQVSWNEVYAIYTTTNTKLPLMDLHVAYTNLHGFAWPWTQQSFLDAPLIGLDAPPFGLDAPPFGLDALGLALDAHVLALVFLCEVVLGPLPSQMMNQTHEHECHLLTQQLNGKETITST